MGDFGEATAQAYQFSRADQDAYAVESLSRAKAAIAEGSFAEVAPITIPSKAGPKVVDTDERIR